jgi:hypothetical protein
MSRIDPESAAEAYIRLIGYAGATGAHMHICHFNSSSKTDVERCATLVAKAQAQGVVFDLETLTDRAEFTAMNRPSEGVRHLLVSGQPLIIDGVMDGLARPGQPVRRPVVTGG